MACWSIEHKVNKLDSNLSQEQLDISALRRLLPGDRLPADTACFSLGEATIDKSLGGGLPIGGLHEILAAEPGDYGIAALFSLLLAQRSARAGRPFFWIGEDRGSAKYGHLYPPGLADMGIDLGRILYASARDPLQALHVAADALRSAAMGAIILSLSGKKPKGLDMTASRRLSLFARESGVPIFMLRDQLSTLAGTAWSRWQVISAPSHPLEADAPGSPVFDVELIRHRGGKEGLSALLEWDREKARFAAHHRPVSAVPTHREDVGGADYREQRKRA